MPIYKIITKHDRNYNGISIEPEILVEVITKTFSNPILTNRANQ